MAEIRRGNDGVEQSISSMEQLRSEIEGVQRIYNENIISLETLLLYASILKK